MTEAREPGRRPAREPAVESEIYLDSALLGTLVGAGRSYLALDPDGAPLGTFATHR